MGLTQDQKKIVTTLDKPLFVAAGAGSGKTFTLTQRIVWALSKGSAKDGGAYLDSLDQVLVITFTNLAAEEIKERVRGALRAAGLEKDALEVDNAWISTIHGMCSRMLKTYALEAGVDPEFSVISGVEASNLVNLSVDEVLSEVKNDEKYKDLFNTFDVSGHGFGLSDGKNTIIGMVSAITNAALASTNGFDDIYFVGETPNPYSYFNQLNSAFGSLSAHKSTNEGAMTNLMSDIETLDKFSAKMRPESTTTKDILDLLNLLHRPSGTYWRGASECCKDVQDTFDLVKYSVLMDEVGPLRQDLVEISKKIVRRYLSKKKARSVLDNDDLLRKAYELLTSTCVSQIYENQFKLVMIDEFQDTNQQQVDMIEQLCGKGAQRLCTVGDAQQSIYRFRGADVAVFESRQESMDSDNVVLLHKNFRSHDDVLRLVAHICGAQDMLPNFMDLEAGRFEDSANQFEGPRAYVELTASSKYRNSKPAAELRSYAQAIAIADRLKKLHDKGVACGDMALLLGRMTNADVFVNAIRQAGLSCVVSGGSTFSDAKEVHIIQALLYTLSNPQDTRRGLFPLLSSEMFRLDANDMAMLATRTQTNNDAPCKRPCDQGFISMDFYGDKEPSPRLIHAHNTLTEAWKMVSTKDIADVVQWVVVKSGWLDRLDRQGVEGKVKAANILAAIEHVRDLSNELGSGAAQTADQFAVWLNVSKEHPAMLVGEKLDAVRVMTIHASKGLEFPVVAVAECLNSPSPASKEPFLLVQEGTEIYVSLKAAGAKVPKRLQEDGISGTSTASWRVELEGMEDERALAEKVRLLYVALTRARECVVLGIDATQAKESIDPYLAGNIVDSLFEGALPEKGEHAFEFGGSQKGICRCVWLRKQQDKSTLIETDDDHLRVNLVCFEGGSLDKEEKEEDIVPERFDIYEIKKPDLEDVELLGMRDDVFSYSSAHASSFVSNLDDIDDDSFNVPVVVDDNQDQTQRAVCLGSAFHELAQRMIDTGVYPTDERIDTTARLWRCTKSQTKRLFSALKRWENSSIRQYALSFKHTVAEAPFFVKVESCQGDYLEGAIDLLCYNEYKKDAFVLDYKTGDANKTLEEIYKSHEMQASFYAHILFLQGFKSVECAFVCVELEDENGEPLVVKYNYSDISQTSL